MTAIAAPPTTGAVHHRRALRRSVTVAVGTAVIAFDVHLLSPYASRAAHDLRHPALAWLVVALVAELGSMAAAARLQRRMLMASGTRVGTPAMIGLTYASNAVSMSLPAGSAISAGYTVRRLRQLGATAPIAGFTMMSSGLLSTLAYGLLAVVAVVLGGGTGGGVFGVVVALLGCGGLALGTRSLLRHLDLLDRSGEWALRLANRIRHADPETGVNGWHQATRSLTTIRPRSRDWASGLAFALLNWLGDIVCLLASSRAVGAHGVTLGLILLAYVGGTSVSSISLVPGGLGVVDVAMTVLLVHGGVATAPAAASVVIYRMFSLGFVVILGWTAWGAQRISRRNNSINDREELTGYANVGA